MSQDHIDKLSLTAEQVKGYQTAAWRRWQQYIEPGDEQVQHQVQLFPPGARLVALYNRTFSPDKEPVPVMPLTKDIFVFFSPKTQEVL